MLPQYNHGGFHFTQNYYFDGFLCEIMSPNA